jgi:hypothetical protein
MLFDAVQSAGTIGSGDVYWAGNPNIIQGYICWDITTGVSWVWAPAEVISQTYPFPLYAQTYDKVGATSITYLNNILFSLDFPRSQVGQAGYANKLRQSISDFNSISPASGGGPSSFLYTDQGLVSGTGIPIAAGVAFNMWDFGNNKYKRIYRVEPLIRMFAPYNTFNATYPYTWVMYNKRQGETGTASGAISPNLATNFTYIRACKPKYPVQRTYINNLGAGRQWMFGVMQANELNFCMKGIELTIVQN